MNYNNLGPGICFNKVYLGTDICMKVDNLDPNRRIIWTVPFHYNHQVNSRVVSEPRIDIHTMNAGPLGVSIARPYLYFLLLFVLHMTKPCLTCDIVCSILVNTCPSILTMTSQLYFWLFDIKYRFLPSAFLYFVDPKYINCSAKRECKNEGRGTYKKYWS